MQANLRRVFYWAPRVLGILFALFISLFALDVFDEGYGARDTVLALLIHLIPTFLIVIALVAAWRWAWVGVVAFPALAVFYLAMSGNVAESLILSGPLLLMGLLFLLDMLLRPARPAT